MHTYKATALKDLVLDLLVHSPSAHGQPERLIGFPLSAGEARFDVHHVEGIQLPDTTRVEFQWQDGPETAQLLGGVLKIEWFSPNTGELIPCSGAAPVSV
jgi:hypothetical protein